MWKKNFFSCESCSTQRVIAIRGQQFIAWSEACGRHNLLDTGYRRRRPPSKSRPSERVVCCGAHERRRARARTPPNLQVAAICILYPQHVTPYIGVFLYHVILCPLMKLPNELLPSLTG